MMLSGGFKLHLGRKLVEQEKRIRELEQQVQWLAERCDTWRRLEADPLGKNPAFAKGAVDEERRYRARHGIDA